jgi:hypothetical protein
MSLVTNLLGRAAIVLSLAMTAVFAGPVGALAVSSDPFLGAYRAVDTAFDDSNMRLTFGGPDGNPDFPGGVRRVIWHDDNATVACEGGAFFGEGIGFVDGNTILVVFELYCGNAGNLIGEDVVEWTADAATGTLTDSFGNVWTRP